MKAIVPINPPQLGYHAFYKAHLKLNSEEDSERLNRLIEEAVKRVDKLHTEPAVIVETLSVFDEMFWRGASRELFGDDPTESEISKAIRALGEYAHQKSIRLNKLSKHLKRTLDKGGGNM